MLIKCNMKGLYPAVDIFISVKRHAITTIMGKKMFCFDVKILCLSHNK